LEPGMNEQWIEWTCRSRCWTKSYVEMPAKMSPASAPTSTTTSHAGGLMRPMLARAASVPNTNAKSSHVTVRMRALSAGGDNRRQLLAAEARFSGARRRHVLHVLPGVVRPPLAPLRRAFADAD